MVDTLGKALLIEAVKEIVKKIIQEFRVDNISSERKKLITEALISIQKAAIKTRNFIQKEGYKTNEELSDLWHDALQKSLDAELEQLPEFLFQKAKFWGNPTDWLNEESSMKLVPKLNYLDEQCEELLIKVKK